MKAIFGIVNRCSRTILGNYITDKIAGIYNYVVHQKNPIVQILYLVLAVGGFAVYVMVGFWKFIPGPYVSEYHETIGTFLMMMCYAAFFTASVTPPGVITHKNNKQAVKKFPYDNIMYTIDQKCTTCKFIKPARSKHCSVCDICIEKFDHHCIWINNCVGLNNYRYFLWFVLSHAIICTYGAIIGI